MSARHVLKPWLTEHMPDALPLIDGKAADLIQRIDAYATHDAAWELARHRAELIRQAEPLSGNASIPRCAIARWPRTFSGSSRMKRPARAWWCGRTTGMFRRRCCHSRAAARCICAERSATRL